VESFQSVSRPVVVDKRLRISPTTSINAGTKAAITPLGSFMRSAPEDIREAV
jgi:hypothetical protein